MLAVRQFALLVDDYDAALAFYVSLLGFSLVEDTPLGADKRWVRVRAPGGGSDLLLARAVTDEQRSRVGDQAGGRVFLFLDTTDFAADHARLCSLGVRFLEEPRRESYGTVAVFVDLYGNKIDLVEPNRDPGARL
jgi:catechol 2,3-dioxygenase-like lactoylglutathione lyase family enzyme